MGDRATKTNLADRAVALRLFLHRRLDSLYKEITSAGFTGTMGIEISAKDGRPGEPRIKLETYGVTEEKQ